MGVSPMNQAQDACATLFEPARSKRTFRFRGPSIFEIRFYEHFTPDGAKSISDVSDEKGGNGALLFFRLDLNLHRSQDSQIFISEIGCCAEASFRFIVFTLRPQSDLEL